MKKRYIISILVFLVLSILISNNIAKSYIEKNNDLNKRPSFNKISIMLETDEATGEYKMSTENSWPTEGYIFNAELSKCENGSTLSWDNDKNAVVFSGDVSDKCYVYFDKYVAPSMTLVEYVLAQFTGVQGENNIYYHTSSLTNGASDNSYRYAGASDSVNNFVCFGTNESPCPTDNLYRIIGVFGDNYHGVSKEQLVKLIKYDYTTRTLLGMDGDYSPFRASQTSLSDYDGYYWNYKNNTSINNGTGSNTWSTSLLNKINLNTNFLTNIGSVWSEIIQETTWKVGGNTHVNIVQNKPSVVYNKEIVNPVTTNSTDNQTTYNAKVGLIYVSDLEFAASPSAWTLVGHNSSDSTKDYRSAINTNWMYMGKVEWTITRISDYTSSSFFISSDGHIDYSYASQNVYLVRPSFFLDSSIMYKSGTGTMSDPIILKV